MCSHLCSWTRSHMRIVASSDEEARKRPSGENASERTPPGCATHSWTICPAESQRMMVESQDPVAIRWLSGEMVRHVAALSWPTSVAVCANGQLFVSGTG